MAKDIGLSVRLRKARKDARFSIAEAATRLGVSPTAIGQWERAGKGYSPSDENVMAASRLYGVAALWLRYGEEVPPGVVKADEDGETQPIAHARELTQSVARRFWRIASDAGRQLRLELWSFEFRGPDLSEKLRLQARLIETLEVLDSLGQAWCDLHGHTKQAEVRLAEFERIADLNVKLFASSALGSEALQFQPASLEQVPAALGLSPQIAYSVVARFMDLQEVSVVDDARQVVAHLPEHFFKR